VNWFTLVCTIPGEDEIYRKARADFNFRGWQGRWRHTAPTTLLFLRQPDRFSGRRSRMS
jgi:hypothetical protein